MNIRHILCLALCSLGLAAAGCAPAEPPKPPAPPANPTTSTPTTPDTATPEPAAPETKTPNEVASVPTTPEPKTPTETNPPVKPVAPVGDLDYKRFLSDRFFGAVVVRPRQILSSKIVASVVEKAGINLDELAEESDFPVKAADIEEVIVLVDQDSLQGVAPGPMMLGPPPGEFEGPQPVEKPEAPEESEEKSEPEEKEDGAKEEGAEEEKPEGQAGLGRRAVRTVAFVQEEAAEEEKSEGEEPSEDAPAETEAEETEEMEEMEGPGGPPLPLVILRLVSAEAAAAVIEKIKTDEDTTEKEIGGHTVYADEGKGLHALALDGNAIVVTSEALLTELLGADAAPGTMAEELAGLPADTDIAVVVDLLPMRDQLVGLAELFGSELPPAFKGVAEIPAKTKLISIQTGLSSKSLLSLTLVGDDDSAGKQLEAVSELLVSFGKEQFNQAAEAIPEEHLEFATATVEGLTVARDGAKVTINLASPEGLDAVVDQLLIPAIGAAKAAAESTSKMNDLKQIALAFHNLHDSTGAFPAAGSATAEEGSKLSWRVHLLPFLDQAALYEEFKLDEPWDSEHNKALIPKIPKIYANSGPAEEGKTTIHVFVGEGTAFGDGTAKPTLAQITDGASNTILCISAGADKADVWTKPGGLTFDAEKVEESLGKVGDFDVLLLFMDGSVRKTTKQIVGEIFQKYVTAKGGEETEQGEL